MRRRPPVRSSPVTIQDRTVEVLGRGGVDIFLTGHLHVSSTRHTAARFGDSGFSSIVVAGGTATSTRVRGEGNAFNLLHIAADTIVVDHFEWQPASGTFDLIEGHGSFRTEKVARRTTRGGRTTGGACPRRRTRVAHTR